MAVIQPPDAITYEPIDERSVRLRWRAVEGVDAYRIRGGGTQVEREIASTLVYRGNSDVGIVIPPETEAVIKGLIPAVHVNMEIRSVRGGVLSEWAIVQVRPTAPIPTPPADTPSIPLLDVDRQSVQLRLPRPDGSEVDVRLHVWWQPSDSGWWLSIEAPTNNPVVSSKRLAVNTGLFDDDRGILAGNIVMRSTSGDLELEPDRNAWRDRTHRLAWELTDGG